MMWLTWRQFRAQTIVTSAALAVLAIVLAYTARPWPTGMTPAASRAAR